MITCEWSEEPFIILLELILKAIWNHLQGGKALVSLEYEDFD